MTAIHEGRVTAIHTSRVMAVHEGGVTGIHDVPRYLRAVAWQALPHGRPTSMASGLHQSLTQSLRPSPPVHILAAIVVVPRRAVVTRRAHLCHARQGGVQPAWVQERNLTPRRIGETARKCRGLMVKLAATTVNEMPTRFRSRCL